MTFNKLYKLISESANVDDEYYLELAKDPEKNKDILQRMVDEAAESVGLNKYFRAGDIDEQSIKSWASFTPELETALAYTNNSSYGGDTIRKIFAKPQNILYADTRTKKGMDAFADEIGRENQDWWSDGWRYPWEESRKVKMAIEYFGFDAVSYIDDFPENATTIVFTRNIKNCQIKSADPVTYDDEENIIPLSQRFDSSKDDIRY